MSASVAPTVPSSITVVITSGCTVSGSNYRYTPTVDCADKDAPLSGCNVTGNTSPTYYYGYSYYVAGLPVHHPDLIEKWLPLDDKHDVYAITIQDASYRKGEGQLVSFLQRYFEDPNPPRHSTIINPIGGNVAEKQELMGDLNYPLKKAIKQTIAHIHEAYASKSLSRFVRDYDSLVAEMSSPPPATNTHGNSADGGGGDGSEAVDLFAILPSASNLAYDVSGRVLNTGLVLSGFREPEITFLPSYCTDVGTAKYNLSKVLGPNYPDRILVKTSHFIPPSLNENGEEMKLLELEEEEDPEKHVTSSDEDNGEEKTGENEEEGSTKKKQKDDDGTAKDTTPAAATTANAALDLAKQQQKTADSAKKRGMGGEAWMYPLTCSSYTATREVRLSDHFPVSAIFECHIVRPIVSIFMREARRAVIAISDLRVTGVSFLEGPTSGGDTYDARNIKALTLQISVKNYIDAVDITSEKYQVKSVPGSLTGQMFSAAFPSPIMLTPAMPTTPSHLSACNLFMAVYDAKDADQYRSRRGATRMSLANIAGPIEHDVLTEVQSEPEWPLLEVPFKIPLELAGTRCGYTKGTIQITYEKIDGDVDGYVE